MDWARLLAYITGTVDQELLLRNEYLAADNRILRAQMQGRLLLTDVEKSTLAVVLIVWADFIRSHMSVLAGTDFFSVEVLTLRGLVTYYVLFFIHLESRRVEIAGLNL